MCTKKLLLILLAFLVPFTIYGQTSKMRVTGTVTDKSGEPLIGAAVSVENDKSGTITDVDGNYSIEVGASTSLVFTYLGYQTQTIRVGSGTKIDVVMQEDSKLLNEVVVVGYGVQKRSDVTGAVVSVKPSDFENMPSTNIVQALQGKLPGLSIVNTGTSAEGSTKMRVRVQNSINADAEPLIILDGVEYSGFLSEINPNDIESMEVLKDASSAAIYGSKAANGVILITTKRGEMGKPTISFSGTYGFSNVIERPDMMDATQFYNFKKQRLGVSDYDTQQYEKGVNTDWLDHAIRTGTSQDYNLSISGGTTDTKYFVAGNVSMIDGVAKNDEFKRYSLRTNLDTQITEWLKFGTSTTFTYTDRPGTKANISSALQMIPLAEAYDANGNIIFKPNGNDPNVTSPLEPMNIQKEDIARGIVTNNYLQVDFPFLKGLSYKLLGGYNYRTRLIETYKSSVDTVEGMNTNGTSIVNNQFKQDWSLENILSFTRDFGVHSIFLTAVYGAKENLTKYHDLTGSGYIGDYRTYYQSENATTLKGGDTYTKRTSISQMFRVNYSYDSRYLFTFTIRRDGDSAFGANNKYGTFPSVALGWNMQEEAFMQDIDWLDRSKIRLSYGENGNQAISAYDTMATMTEEYILDNDGNSLLGFYSNKLADPTLSWETTRQVNIGWDFSFLRGRIFGSVDAYFANSYDLLLNKVIPQINSVNNIKQNLGKTKSHGIELALSTVNIKTKDFSWKTDFNIAHAKNEIVNVGLFDENGKALDNVANSWFIGKSINVIYAYEFDGIWQETDDILTSHMPTAKPGDVKVIDHDGDGKITTDDKHVIGHKDPDFTIGFMNTFNYKNFTLSFFFNAVHGITRYTEYMNTYFEKNNIRQREWWTPENKINTYPANRDDSNPYGLNYFGKSNDASYIRLSDISLGYVFPQKLFKSTGIKRLEVFGNVKNVFTLTNFVGLDPEFTSDYSIPQTRSFLFGLRLSL